MLDLRGHGLLGDGRFGPAYWQDHAPVREARRGRRARGPPALPRLRRGRRRRRARRRRPARRGPAPLATTWCAPGRYLTGGMGSRHRDEAFGDPYELPPDRAYAETCAAIASVMLAWRLLLATGEARLRRRHRAGHLQRRAVRPVAVGHRVLLRQPAAAAHPPRLRGRRRTASARRGRPCACCPPNLMRLLSSWQQYLATSDDDGRPDPPVRRGRHRRGDRRATGRGVAVAHRLPVGRPRRPSTSYRHPSAVDAVAAGARLVRAATLTVPASAGRPRSVGPGTVDRRGMAGRRRGGPRPRPAGAGHRARPAGRRRARLRRVRAWPAGLLRRVGRPAATGVELEDIRWDPAREPVHDCRGRTSATAWSGVAVPVVTARRASRSTAAARDSVLSPGPTAASAAMRVWIPRRGAARRSPTSGGRRRGRAGRGRLADDQRPARRPRGAARGRAPGSRASVDRQVDGVADDLRDRHPRAWSARAPCGRRSGCRRSRRPTAARARWRRGCARRAATPTATRSVEVATAVGGSGSASRRRRAASPPASVFGQRSR